MEVNDYIIGAEWLPVNEKEVFDRAENRFTFGKSYEKDLKKLTKLEIIGYILIH